MNNEIWRFRDNGEYIAAFDPTHNELQLLSTGLEADAKIVATLLFNRLGLPKDSTIRYINRANDTWYISWSREEYSHYKY